MLKQSGNKDLTKHGVKTLLGLILGLGVFGLGSPAYAYQEVYNARVVAYGCSTPNTCKLTIDQDHAVTTSTASCVRRVFAWNPSEKTSIFSVAQHAYDHGRLVRLRYSEYRCYYGYMALDSIWLQ